MKNKLSYICILLILILSSCTKEEFQTEGDFFYLDSAGAKMPVWVKGNQASKKFIILLHGGPEGGSAQYYTIFPSHKKMETQFAIVYWDQRMCGMSQGNPSMLDATLEQFTEDLDQLVALINHQYDSPKLYLMGHSWGGALGTNYLLKHQDKIAGWIEIDGGHSWTSSNAISRDMMMAYAEKKIQLNDEKDYWQFALNWYQDHPVVGINDNTHYTFVGKANGYDYNPLSDSLSIPFTNLLFFSPISTAYFFVPYKFSFLNNGLDLQNEIHKIKIPTLICWGQHDKVFPVETAYDTYNKLGTSAADKSIYIFDISAHSPNYEQPGEFANEVIRFVNKH
jgi:proline iminopeptidase